MSYAARNGHAGACRCLLRGGADPDAAQNEVWIRVSPVSGLSSLTPSSLLQDGYTPLMYAAEGNHESCISALAKGKASLEKEDKVGRLHDRCRLY